MAFRLLCTLALAVGAASSSSFDAWLLENPRNYGGSSGGASSHEEYRRRARIFAANDAYIRRHNADPHATSELGHSEFSDLSEVEFRARLGFREELPARSVPDAVFTGAGAAPPTSVDWRTSGKVTAVKNQGSCGSCWSFSSTGCLEGARAIAYNLTYDATSWKTGEALSEQMLMDCAYKVGHSCKGGNMDHAWKFSKAHGGLCSEQDYPYKHHGENCTDSKCKVVCGTASDKVSHVQKSESALLAAVSQQPVSVGVDAKPKAFQHFKSGVVTGTCGTKLDHAVLVVGFGTEVSKNGTSLDYWLVKNSWGASWGEKGFVKVHRGGIENGGKGQCGILQAAEFTSVDTEDCPPPHAL